jgi:16S rRNA (uracil1498-N3)-methyltransferase
LAVGPEGGWTEAETRLLDSRGYRGLRMGPRVLRSETAGPAALAVFQARFGDWR